MTMLFIGVCAGYLLACPAPTDAGRSRAGVGAALGLVFLVALWLAVAL